MYLSMYSPTWYYLRLRFNGRQVYKKLMDYEERYELKTLDDVKMYIKNNTRFTKEFDDYEFDPMDQGTLTNPYG